MKLLIVKQYQRENNFIFIVPSLVYSFSFQKNDGERLDSISHIKIVRK